MTSPPPPPDKRPSNDPPYSGPYAGLSVNSARRYLKHLLEQAELADCETEARELVMAAADLSRVQLITQGTELLLPQAAARLQGYGARRIAGEPVDHILGWREFYGRRFNISKDVLSPRQETEDVLAAALKTIAHIQDPYVLDLGTGSGALITTLLCARDDARGMATDIAQAALKIAQDNARAYNVANRAEFRLGDWLAPVEGEFDLIISNPPYIESGVIKGLSREVRRFDPKAALDGGADGLTPYRILARGCPAHMKPHAELVLEIGYNQGESVPNILRAAGFRDVNMACDINGLPRIVQAKRP